jgi:hypothetical protein
MASFKERKTIALHQDPDITDETAELDGASLSSADVETSTHVELQPFLFAELTVFFCRNMAWKQMVRTFPCCVGCQWTSVGNSVDGDQGKSIFRVSCGGQAFVNACFRNRKDI